jgi:tetratricopeptide (TPR) repeat protein
MSTTQRVWALISENPSRTAAIAGSVVAVVVIIFLGTYLKERAGEKRVTAVSQAVGRYVAEGGEEERGPVLDELKGLAEKHARTAPGGQALYFLGGMLVEQGDFRAAAETYRRVGEDHASNQTLAASADLARGYSHILLGELDDARQVFSGLLERGGVPVPRTQIEMEIGSILEQQGKREEAASAYRRLAESDPDGRWGVEAAARLRILEGA